MIDEHGYRANIGIIIMNPKGLLLWAKRIGQDAWQFPQGGMQIGETPKEALYRELKEEVGLAPKDVTILGQTQGWLTYDLPAHLVRHERQPLCIGQKQKWFLLLFEGDDVDVALDTAEHPEFDAFCWVSYWHPVEQVIAFKQSVYQQALAELRQYWRQYMSGRQR